MGEIFARIFRYGVDFLIYVKETLTQSGVKQMVAIFVIGTILAFLLIDFIVQRANRREEVKPVRADRFIIPRGYFFGRGHAWVYLLSSGKVRVGVDDFVQKIVGDIDEVDIVPVGSEVEKGQPLFTLKQGSRKLSVSAPLSGVVVAVNPTIASSPDLMKKDPYNEGWVALIQPRDVAAEIKKLSVADEAVSWLRGELKRFREFITARTYPERLSPAGVTLLDGGVPISGVLEHAEERIWEAFEKAFLSE